MSTEVPQRIELSGAKAKDFAADWLKRDVTGRIDELVLLSQGNAEKLMNAINSEFGNNRVACAYAVGAFLEHFGGGEVLVIDPDKLTEERDV